MKLKTKQRTSRSGLMKSGKFPSLSLLVLLLVSGNAFSGPFEPAAGQPGSTAVANSDPAIAGWATGVSVYQPGPLAADPFDDPSNALGAAEGNSLDIVSLGAGGFIDLTFSGSIFNGPGWDILVFENGFSDDFLELARVQVSSNGTDFFEFPGIVDPGLSPIGTFGSIDTTDIANTITISGVGTFNTGYAGKYIQGFGTPLDLEWFVATGQADDPNLNLNVNDITTIRILDIVGDGSFTDIFGNPVYDPSPETSPGGGFDLDGVAARYLTTTPVPLPGAFFPFLLTLITTFFGVRKFQQPQQS